LSENWPALDHNFPPTRFSLTRLYHRLCFVEDNGIFTTSCHVCHKSHLSGCLNLSMDKSTKKNPYSDRRPSPPGLLSGSRLATLSSKQPPQRIPRKPIPVPSKSTYRPEVNNPTRTITAKSTEGQNFSPCPTSSEETRTHASSTLLQKSKKSQPSTSSTVTNLVTNWWLLELLVAVFALTIFVALVVLLWSYNDAPVPLWPHGITVSGSRSISIIASLLTRKAQRGDFRSVNFHKVITVDGVGRGDQSVKMAVVPEH
jgi:hypothetical protein